MMRQYLHQIRRCRERVKELRINSNKVSCPLNKKLTNTTVEGKLFLKELEEGGFTSDSGYDGDALTKTRLSGISGKRLLGAMQ